MNLSHLDKKYFIDPHVYNCPFCKRGNVSYTLIDDRSFDWSHESKCYTYFVKCESCDKISVHFAHSQIIKTDVMNRSMNRFQDIDIDMAVFYSQPSSFFTLDQRIPKGIRELVSEAENSRKANMLTGASACLRKSIYELMHRENSIVIVEKTGRTDYKASVKKLKQKLPHITPELIDALGQIQEMSSDKVHEESWEAWDSNKIRFLIELLKRILLEIYVVPAERDSVLANLNKMKSSFVESKDANRG